MYVLLVAALLWVAYLLLYALFPLFFTGRLAPMRLRSLLSLIAVAALSLLVSALSFSFNDLELGNRVLHIFGGGFITFFICFVVVMETRVPITRFQFFVFSFLIVTALGVTNEVIEYWLQYYRIFTFANTAVDTWLDLMSNWAGALLASACFVPLVRPRDTPPR